MSKKFNIREWVLSVKYWSLLFIPHVAVCFIFIIYTFVGASIIQEIELDDLRLTSSSTTTLETTLTSSVTIKNFDRERDRLVSKIADKRQTADAPQYMKYVLKHIREYEEEIKKSYQSTVTTTLSTRVNEKSSLDEENLRWTFSGSLYFIATTLTTIGSNDFKPTTNIGKLFVMTYAAIGIPLTLVFLSDLSLLIARLIKYLSLLLLRAYSTKYFLQMRQWMVFRFIEQQLDISIQTPTEEDDFYSLKLSQSLTSSMDNLSNENEQQINRATLQQRRLSNQLRLKQIKSFYNILVDTLKDMNDDTQLTMPQLLITLFIYIIIGACLIKTDSFFDSIYICFTSIFTINLNTYYRHAKIRYDNNIKSVFILATYLLFGLAIVSLCIKVVQVRIQTTLENIGKKILRDLVEFLRQMGFHELSTDDILTAANAIPQSTSSSDSLLIRQRSLYKSSSKADSLSSMAVVARPIGIAEPVRRLSSGVIIRAYKTSDNDTSTDKSVQVNTIIRSCGRCAGSTPSPATSVLSLKKHNAVTISPSSPGENSSGCEEDENITSTLQPPNLDRLRQRRATLVAKTIINQMATQPAALSIDEPVPPLKLLNNQRHRPTETTPPIASKYSTTKLTSIPSEPSRLRDVSQEQFSEISKQISSLLVPSDDEN